MLFREENRYLDIARKILDEGYYDPPSESRTGIGATKLHVEHMEFTLLDGKVPILSTRKVPYKNPIIELCWFASGSTDIKFLKDRNCPVWDQWVLRGTEIYDQEIDVGLRELEKRGLIKFGEDMQAKARRADFMLKYGDGLVAQLLGDLTGVEPPARKLLGGSIGPGAYGAQWRKWEDTRAIPYNDEAELNKLTALGYRDLTDEILPGAVLTDNPALRIMRKEYDQLQEVIDRIKNKPCDRRIIVSAWNPGRLDQAALPPCHSFFQFLPFEKNGVKYLDLSLTCRSQDFLLGTVFNVMQYGVLCHLVAKLTGRVAHKLYWTGNNTHIYDNQKEIFDEYHRERSPLKNNIKLEIADSVQSIADFLPENIQVTGYDNFMEPIKYPIAV